MAMVTHSVRESTGLTPAVCDADGFTLIEIMMVATIIGILITIAVFGFAAPLSRVRRVACYTNQRVLREAVMPYQLDHNGAKPTTISDLLPYVQNSVSIRCPSDPAVDLIYNVADSDITCPLHP